MRGRIGRRPSQNNRRRKQGAREEGQAQTVLPGQPLCIMPTSNLSVCFSCVDEHAQGSPF